MSEPQSHEFGLALPTNSLPTNEDVLNGVLHYKDLPEMYHTKLEDIAKLFVLPILTKIWQKTYIPILVEKSIKTKIDKFIKQYRNSRKNKKNEEKFHSTLDILFNISKCSCFFNKKTKCNCLPPNQIPPSSLPFYIDQITTRKLFICSFFDLNNSTSIHITSNDCIDDTNNNVSNFCNSIGTGTSSNILSDTSKTTTGESDGDSLYTPDEKEKTHLSVPPQNVTIPKCIRDINTKPISEAADRFGSSNSEVAHLMNSVFEGMNMINKECKGLVVTPDHVSKFRDADRMEAVKLRDKQNPSEDLLCFHFDGKRNNNLQMTASGSSKRTKKKDNSKSFENIQVVKQPGSTSLGFFAAESGKAKQIFSGLWQLITKGETEEPKSLFAIGCDGTCTNIGVNGGVIRLFEEKLKRPLHWIICIFHLLDIILGDVFCILDGRTTSPHSYIGPIGKQFNTDLHKRQVVAFKKYAVGELPREIDKWKLDGDQGYLYKMSIAVSTGIVSDDLANAKPGKVCNARWLNKAASILRIFVSTTNPSTELIDLVQFIQRVYVPLWFAIKENPSWTFGSKHIFKIVKWSREVNGFISTNLFEVVQKSLQNNGYFLHVENVLISMITDTRKNIRNIAYSRILNARINRRQNTPNPLRTFTKLKATQLNFDCNDYFEMIDWRKLITFEPPFTQQYSDEELKMFVNSDDIIMVPDIPCHTQATEHCIQALSETVGKICGEKRQNGYLENKITSRKRNINKITKKGYIASN